MSMLKRLRGQPEFTLPCLGKTLTLYRQGSRWALFVGLATVTLLNLPWHAIPVAGQILQALIAIFGFYFAAALLASRTPVALSPDDAAARWL